MARIAEVELAKKLASYSAEERRKIVAYAQEISRDGRAPSRRSPAVTGPAKIAEPAPEPQQQDTPRKVRSRRAKPQPTPVAEPTPDQILADLEAGGEDDAE